MKTKNVKVKFNDVREGRVVYVSHPAYGIEKIKFAGRPYVSPRTGSWFVKTHCGGIHDFRSLCDMGITDTYNDRRTFFKLRQAREWMLKWESDKGYMKRQLRHERMVADYDSWEVPDWHDDEYDEDYGKPNIPKFERGSEVSVDFADVELRVQSHMG